jgi:hypothetical protein
MMDGLIDEGPVWTRWQKDTIGAFGRGATVLVKGELLFGQYVAYVGVCDSGKRPEAGIDNLMITYAFAGIDVWNI